MGAYELKERIQKLRKRLIYDALSAVVAIVFSLVLHMLDVLFAWELPGKCFLWALVLLMYILMVCDWIGLKRMLITAVSVALSVGIVVGSLGMGWLAFSRNGTYRDDDDGKTAFYGGRRIMLIVPHQDDEINLLGGVIEEYVRYGSELYVVYVTNGDYGEIPMVRYWEALEVLGNLGVPQEQVIFMGYGDQYAEGMPHIYNAAAGEVIPSHFGKTETYGADFHPAYREGRPYTRDNFLDDLQSVILEYQPDVLFCSDYDSHPDHKALTLAFDKVMGRILKENADYRPAVYKGFAYNTAWNAPDDYYAENVASTLRATGESGVDVYRWEDRVRLPVDGGSLSRSLVGAPAYRSLLGHKSQYAWFFAGKIINGDRVFWRRWVNSLCTAAEIRVSSGTEGLLNDFMLIENNDVLDEERKPYDGVWIPETEDSVKEAQVVLAETSQLHSIVLYDHPAPDQNVTAVEISFDDGSCVAFGALDPDGAATELLVQKENVSSFTVRILSGEGDDAGLTEIEAFAEAPAEDGSLLKLMDENENFVYDYWTSREGEAVLSVYTYGLELPDVAENLTVTVSNPKCAANWEEDRLYVRCPRGQETQLTIADGAGTVSDRVTVRNPGSGVRLINGFCQWLESRLFDEYKGETFKPLLEAPVVQWAADKARMLKYYLVG